MNTQNLIHKRSPGGVHGNKFFSRRTKCRRQGFFSFSSVYLMSLITRFVFKCSGIFAQKNSGDFISRPLRHFKDTSFHSKVTKKACYSVVASQLRELILVLCLPL